MKDAEEGIVVVGDGQDQGNGLRQFNHSWAIVVDQSGSVHVTDYWNYRVIPWPKGAEQGMVIAGGNGRGEHNPIN